MTVTDPPPVRSTFIDDGTPWMTFGDPQSQQSALDLVRSRPGEVTLWLVDLPTRFTPEQEAVLWELALRARTLVVPSRCALTRVLASGVVHPASVAVVPLPTRFAEAPGATASCNGRGPLLVTPTALHPAEHPEHVLDALAGLRRQGVQARYHVVVDPSTHHRGPVARGHDTASRALARWEAWQVRAARLGLSDHVQWSLDGDALAAIASAHAVVLPWEADDLVASQALVDAMSVGVPVVASAFPHAVELAPTGAVVLWRSDSRHGLERALHRVLTRPLLRTAMRHAARQASRVHQPDMVRAHLDRLSQDAVPGHW